MALAFAARSNGSSRVRAKRKKGLGVPSSVQDFGTRTFSRNLTRYRRQSVEKSKQEAPPWLEVRGAAFHSTLRPEMASCQPASAQNWSRMRASPLRPVDAHEPHFQLANGRAASAASASAIAVLGAPEITASYGRRPSHESAAPCHWKPWQQFCGRLSVMHSAAAAETLGSKTPSSRALLR